MGWRRSNMENGALRCLIFLLCGALPALCITYVAPTSTQRYVLTKNLPPGEHNFGPINGAIVMSEEFYSERNFNRSVYFQPSEPAARLLVQFVYIYLPKRVGRQTRCQDSLSICEAGDNEDGQNLRCEIGIISDFCGDLRDLFIRNDGIRRLRYVATSHPGRALNIQWKVGRRVTHYKGFQLIVTSFLSESTECGHDLRYWQCKDARCIARELHCDGIPHCPDGTDEMVNCSNSGVLIPVGHGCQVWQGGVCNGKTWKERWFGLAIPMVIVMILLLIAIFVRIRKQLRNPPPAIASARLRHMRTRRNNMTHYLARGLASSQACTLAPSVHHVIQQDPVAIQNAGEPASFMLLPPPYSPPECLPYEPPYNGEPPPEYEEHGNDQEKLTPSNAGNINAA